MWVLLEINETVMEKSHFHYSATNMFTMIKTVTLLEADFSQTIFVGSNLKSKATKTGKGPLN